MIDVSDKRLDELLAEAMDELERAGKPGVQNVAVVWADEPTQEQRIELQLHPNETLFGLYRGVPLARRQGRLNDFPPDVITIFRGPILRSSSSEAQLKEQLKHTLWHEIAHYVGLNHQQIHELE